MIIHNFDQGSPEWTIMRIGKITGTRGKDLMKSDNMDLVYKLIAEIETEQSQEKDYVSQDMERGTEYEPFAADKYTDVTGIKTEKVGFIQCSTYPLLGFSPDRVVFKGDKIIGGVEIKCPKTSTHVKRIIQSKLPADHKEQVYLPFLICPDVQWWDFVSFDDRFRKKPIFIHRTHRENILGELNEMGEVVRKFFEKLEKKMELIKF